MPFIIETTFSKAVWNEWKQRVNSIKQYTVRKVFYPHNMDNYESICRAIEKQQRLSTQKAISFLPYVDEYEPTKEEMELWRNHSKLIREYGTELISYVKNEDIETFIDNICTMENARLHDLKGRISSRKEKEDREEAAEALLLMRKRANQQLKRKHTEEMRTQNIESGNMRRSARFQEKN